MPALTKIQRPATPMMIFHVAMPAIDGTMKGAERTTATANPPRRFPAFMLTDGKLAPVIVVIAG
jgi:hypothetical protein